MANLSDDEKLQLLALQGYCELASEALSDMQKNLQAMVKMFENLKPIPGRQEETEAE